MKHPSLYLNWYLNVPSLKYDLRSSGLSSFKYDLTLGKVDLSVNFGHGNPEVTQLLSQRYHVQPQNIFVSSEGASGQNARTIRYLAEKNKKKTEAIVEYPTYEPLLRQVQEHFPIVKRLERKDEEAYSLDADELRGIASKKTSLLVLTNPHAPSGAIADTNELREIMTVADEFGFYVLCDEIYAEFNRSKIPTIFSIDPQRGIVTTSFTKAYGLGGVKLGIALADSGLVDELYLDTLNTVGVFSNLVSTVTAALLADGGKILEKHKQKWAPLKKQTEEWLNEKGFEYFPNKAGVTYWVRLPIDDTHHWANNCAITKYSLAPVPGAFFLFKNKTKLGKSRMIRLGLGNINPDSSNLMPAFERVEHALKSYR